MFRHVDVSNGKYRSPARILRVEGGTHDEDAVANTKRFIDTCIKLRPPLGKNNNQFGK